MRPFSLSKKYSHRRTVFNRKIYGMAQTTLFCCCTAICIVRIVFPQGYGKTLG